MEDQLNVIILTEGQIKQIITETVERLLAQRIPEIIRKANRKEILTTNDVKEFTGMSSRIQKYHRDKGNIPYSQEGRKIFYKTVDVERFIDERRVGGKRR